MKALIVYDSAYGNTTQIAQAISGALKDDYRITLIPADRDEGISVDDFDLLVVGSPTQGGRATIAVQEFLNKLPQLNGKKAAVFDTRFSKEGHGFGLRLIMKTVGFAASKMAEVITKKGGNVIAQPEGFIVNEKTGPLKEGEIVRAATWARNLSSNRAALTAS